MSGSSAPSPAPEITFHRRAFLTPLLALVIAAGCRADGPSPLPAPPRATPFPGPTAAPQTPAPEPSPAASPSVALREGPPRLEKIGDFRQPAGIFSPPGDPRLFVVERGGTVQMLSPDGSRSVFLDIRGSVSSGGERGLLSVAFAPDYEKSGLAYVYYTDTRGDSRIVEYRVDPADPARLDPGSRRELLFVPQPFSNHNGGLILFDPAGMLLIGLGDGGGSGDPGNRAQNLAALLGKLLRIDPRKPSGDRPYGIPPDNPFVGRAGARPEIWAFGLRNPWRYAFDRDTEDLYVADVGQNRFEEINFVPPGAQAGANYGWRRYEGHDIFRDETIDESRLVRPVLTYPLNGTCSVIGGNVYRGPVAALREFYLYADYCGRTVSGFKVRGGSAVEHRRFEELRASSVVAFGEDSSGEMYVVSISGPVYRIST